MFNFHFKGQVALILLIFLFNPYTSIGQSKTNLQFNEDLLFSIFSDNNNKEESRLLVTIPDAKGQFKSAVLQKDALLGKELQAQFPSHNNYQIIELDGKKTLGKILVTPDGVFINHHTKTGLVSIYPDTNSENYFLEKGVANKEDIVCGIKNTIQQNQSRSVLTTNGDFLRAYKMALVTTGEFYQANGNNDSAVMSWIMFSMNGLNIVFENDMAMRFDLGNRVFLYTDPNNDPFTPNLDDDNDDRPFQAGAAVADRFNTNDYDIGHVFHNHLSNPDWKTGGVAQLRSLCSSQMNGGSPNKARGWSGAFTNQTNSWIQLMTHEIGHQCGALHTFNGSGASCDDAISDGHSFEIGSGSTIMSYQGTCGEGQNTTPLGVADNYFHVDNLYDMLSHAQDNANCHTLVATGNNTPSINPNPCGVTEYRIPKDTPFRVIGEASDIDGDLLTYCWEQYDEDGNGTSTQGEIGNQAAINLTGPNFRSFPPSTSPERIFPAMNTLLSFESDPFEALPRVPRDLNFKFTVRDNNSNGGAFAIEDLNIKVESTGPFNISAPTQNDDLTSGQDFNITWNTGGSDDLCNNVDIMLSVDGGRTFTIPIASQIAYSAGSYNYSVPSAILSTDEAVIKIECIDYTCFSFFEITNLLTVESTCEGMFTTLCEDSSVAALQGDASLNLNATYSFGEIQEKIQINVSTSDQQANTVRNGTNGLCQQIIFPSGANVVTPHDYYEFEVSETGDYIINTESTDFRLFYIFDAETYNPTNPCSSFVTSNANEDPAAPNTTSTFASPVITVPLEKCRKYLAAATFFNTPVTVSLQFNGPGEIFDNKVDFTDETAYTFAAFNKTNDVVEGVSNIADFTTIGGGQFDVFGVQYENGSDPNTWIGKSKVDLLIDGTCLTYSSNSRILDVTALIVDNDGDGFLSDVDCNDDDSNINPNAIEIVNNDIDEDCDGIAQMIDVDMDGFNSDNDCDDDNADINPSAIEIPNNDIDEDCDGIAQIIDVDMDGFNSDEDCNDTNADINPNATEIINNDIDEDCDGEAIVVDEDNDGFNSDDDCNDSNPDINPNAIEVINNDIDEDCDGLAVIVDEDNDGFNSDDDCDDSNPEINPDALEIANNSIDEDCDGEALVIDDDGDGFNSDEDCDDSNADVNPDATEIVNNDIDEDCDGLAEMIDEDMDGYNSDEDCDDTNADINPGATEIPMNDIDEDCDGLDALIDNDMDGFTSNEDCDDDNADINPDAIEIANNDIDEDCDGELLIIDDDNDGFNSDEDCNDENPDINPDAIEVVNNDVDEDCDGEAQMIDQDNDGFNSDEDCDDENPDIYPGATEILDNEIDEDCDGEDLSDVHEIDGIKLSLFPNPTNGILFIEKEKDIQLDIKVINMHGQVLLQTESIETALHKIDIQDFAPGTYLIEISNPKSQSKVFEQIIKVD